MTLQPINRHPFETTFQAVAMMVAVLASSGCTNDARDRGAEIDGPTTSESSVASVAPSASDAELTSQIQAFCGACHTVPLPDSFPKQAWFDEVKRGFEFYYESGRQDLKPPPQAAVAAWYQKQATDQLAEPEQSEAPGPSLRFEMRSVNVGVAPAEAAAVSVVRLFDSSLGPSQFCVSDMQRGLVVRCDVNDPASSSSFPIGLNPAGTCDVDLDQDGSLDLVVADLGSLLPEDHQKGQVLWMRGGGRNSTGSSPEVILDAIGRVADVKAGDLDNDGDQDLVVAEFGWHKTGGIHVLFNDLDETGKRTFRDLILDSRPGTIHVPVTDLDGDGRLDFVALISQEHEVIEAFLNRETGFEKVRIHAAPDPSYGSSGIELTDMDNDGDADILYTVGDTFDSYLIKPYHGIWLLRNHGELRFEPQRIAAMPGVHRAVGADLDGDGDQDIVAAALLPSKSIRGKTLKDLQALIWLEQSADGSFARHVIQRGLPIYASLAVSDIDEDGDLDVVAGCFIGEPVDPPFLLHVFENQRLSK